MTDYGRMRNFTKFPEMYKVLTEHPQSLLVRLEKRPERYMFGVKNYGEILRHFNPADKDMWDIIVAGYKDKLPTGIPFKVSKLIGMYMLPNGNHKFVVDIERNAWAKTRDIKKEMETYKKNYEKFTKLRGSLIFFKKH